MLRALFARNPAHCTGGTLIVQPLPGIGDMVWHLPHLHGISAHAGMPVTVLTKPRSLADRLLVADSSIRQVLWLERNPGRHDGWLGLIRLAAMLRRHRFAEAWLLHGSGRYALALLLAGIPRTIGFGRGAQRWLLSEPLFLPADRTHGHPIRLADDLLAAHAVTVLEDEPRLPVSETALARVRERFGYFSLPWIALGIGSSEPYKQWGAENFALLIEKLRRHIDATFFAVGGPADAPLATAIADHCGTEARLIRATDMPIDETAALLQQCRLYVGNDTGAMNIAAAVGTTAIGLFGASPPLLHSRHIKPLQPTDGNGMRGFSVEEITSEALGHLIESSSGAVLK